MKLLGIGDIHAKMSQFTLCCSVLQWLNQVIVDEQPDMIVNFGDTMNDHSVLRSEILTEFRKHIVEAVKVANYYYILGNHDFYKPTDSKYHALETFKDIAGMHVIDTVQRIGDITFVPHMADMGQFPLDTGAICLAHQTFLGADYGFHRPELGVDPSLVAANIIISGHIHKRQVVDKVIYPGSPFAQNANDVDQSKGVIIFDTDTYEYHFIEAPFPKWFSIKVNWNDFTNKKDVHAFITQSVNGQDNFLIDIEGPRAEVSSYIDSKDMTNLRASASIRVRPIYIDLDKIDRVSIKASTMPAILSEYIDKVYKGSIDKTVLKTCACEVAKLVRQHN